MSLSRPFPCFHSCFRLLITIVLSGSCFPVLSQDNFFEKVYTSENGLAHNLVQAIAQDSTGFIWLGTWDGLSRFDGYEFHNYFHDPNDKNTIPAFSVQQLEVDKYNNVWILSLSDQLCRYNRSADNFETIDLKNDSVLRERHINCIALSNEGELMTGGPNGITLFDHPSGNFIGFSISDEKGVVIENAGTDDIYFDYEGFIWLNFVDSYIRGVFDRFNKTIRITDRFPSISFQKIIMPGGLHRNFHFTADISGDYWYVSNWGCIKLSSRKETFFSDSERPVLPQINKPEWFKSSNKIVVNTGAGQISEIDLEEDEYPFTVCIGKDNTIWYSTMTPSGISTGLHRYQKTPGFFHHYFSNYEGKPVGIFSIGMDKDKNLLAGPRGSNFVAKIDPKGKMSKINILTKEEVIQSGHPRAIIADSSGIWIGYMRQRLDHLDYLNSKWSSYITNPDPTDPAEPISFRALYKLPGGDLLIGSYCLYRFQKNAEKPFRKLWPEQRSNKNIYCFVRDSKGRLWAGSNSQVLRFDNNYEVDTVYTISEADYTVEDLCVDDDGTLWLALMGAGIEHFDPVTGKKEFFTTSNGLSNNTTYSIQKDHKGNFWITTDNGISRFSPKTRKFRIYGYSDGLNIREFNSDASYQTPEGYIYFGGMGGVVGFYPDSADGNGMISPKANLIITEFRVSGSAKYFAKPVYLSDTVILAKGDNNFGVTFAVIDYRNAEKISYRYRLLGQADNWIETGYLHRNINFAGLRPGKYSLQIEATDVSGYWSHQTSLLVIIPARFYQTTWFALLAGLFTVMLIVFLLYLNNHRIRMKEKQKQQYLKLETVRGQMNPHFIFNSLNSINYFIARSDRLSANRYIANFSKLIRSFLNNMSQEYIPLSDEIASIKDYLTLEYLRFGDKFEYEINTNGIGDNQNVEVFPGMVQPFIENAIWHGVRGLHHKGFIRIDFEFTNNVTLKCIITDNGIGRRLADKNRHDRQERKSHGINLIRERMQIINHLEKRKYRIEIEDLHPEKNECGTKVIIDIPIKNQN